MYTCMWLSPSWVLYVVFLCSGFSPFLCFITVFMILCVPLWCFSGVVEDMFFLLLGSDKNWKCPKRAQTTGTQQYNILQSETVQIITKIRLFKYTENFTIKKWKFSDKKSDIFYIYVQNIDCKYSLEPPQWGGSNEYPQSMFSAK